MIRTFHPDVVARFSEPAGQTWTPQASSILALEAAKAAADPNRFPEQIKEGLQTGRPGSFTSGMSAASSSTCLDENYTLKLIWVRPIPHWANPRRLLLTACGISSRKARRLDSRTWRPLDLYKRGCSINLRSKPTRKDFFDGIDTSLTGLTSRFGDDKNNFPLLNIL